ncbi:type II toxin-antitoxin system VapC family toxin [Candidatus Thiosymbion oneisti]|uniref:type II toxin-antitoxin system VapC family toxin n=1 Tax=Candidatus Thiosymbion oneisti TaxID=589554 RepID=UPI00210BDD7A|nr:type II toxin-antitoxin system VapC family toxin [Candidatus Thiosymbion oneisti]
METSVVSYLVARPSRNIVVAAHQASTSDFWSYLGDYVVFVSDIVIQEASKGDESQAKLRLQRIQAFQVLEIDDEIKELARKFLLGEVIPKKCPEGALHIAVAASNGMDVIVTWNFKHINNPSVRKKVREIVEAHGWACPEICSPEEFLGDNV